jgi:hypothetical protein
LALADTDIKRLEYEGADAAEERFQLKLHTEMAKSRDKLLIEDGVSEADIDTTIRFLKLEMD